MVIDLSCRAFKRWKPWPSTAPAVEFKRQVGQEFVAGETLHSLSSRHDVSRNLIRIWVRKFEAGTFDEDSRAAHLMQDHEAKIAALERVFASSRAAESGADYCRDPICVVAVRRAPARFWTADAALRVSVLMSTGAAAALPALLAGI